MNIYSLLLVVLCFVAGFAYQQSNIKGLLVAFAASAWWLYGNHLLEQGGLTKS